MSVPRPRRRRAHLAGVLLAIGALAVGCTVIPREPDPGVDFRLRGKIAVRGVSDAFSASFDWVQTGERFEVELWGPLGQGRVRLRGDGASLTITDARGATAVGVSAEPFMSDTLGWSVPISALPHWVRGRYHPDNQVVGEWRAADGSLEGFEQFGWTVELSRWGESAVGPVPWRIVAAQTDRKIVIVCKEWSVG